MNKKIREIDRQLVDQETDQKYMDAAKETDQKYMDAANMKLSRRSRDDKLHKLTPEIF